MRTYDKKEHIKRANILFEQRNSLNYVNENKISDIGNGLKNVFNKTKNVIGSLPTPTVDNQFTEKARVEVAKTLGFAKEQWDDEENQAKLKEAASVLGNAISKISSAGKEFFSDSQKLSNAIRGLGIAKYLPLIGVVYGIMNPNDIEYFKTASEAIGGVDIWNFDFSSLSEKEWGPSVLLNKFSTAINFAYLGLGLWAMQLLLKVIKGAVDFGSVVKGITSFIFKFVKFVFSSLFKAITFIFKKGRELSTQESVSLFNESHELIQSEFKYLLI